MANRRDFAVDVDADVAGGTVVQVSGDLDLSTSGELEAALAGTDPGGRIVVDLTACEFLDSSGLRVLLSGASRSESEGGRFLLVAPDPRIRRVIELTGVEAKLSIHDTREAALAS